MVRSSKTMDFTGFPPVRRRTSGVLSVNAEGPHAGWGNLGSGTAHTGYPHDIVCPGENRPRPPAASRNPGLLKASDDQPPTGGPQGTHLLSRSPNADRQRLRSKPGAQPGALLLLRYDGSVPTEPPSSPSS